MARALVLTSRSRHRGCPVAMAAFRSAASRDEGGRRVCRRENASGLIPSHAQCFLAIDPYALDTVSVPVGAFYAGWMYRLYLAWDRQASTESWIQRQVLLRGSGDEHIAWRLLRRLRKNIPVLMVFAGGLPQNARLLYAAREFIHHLKLPRWPSPKRVIQKKLMEILMEPVDGVRPAEQGETPAKVLEKVRFLLMDLGLADPQVMEELRRFLEEFRLSIPQARAPAESLNPAAGAQGKPLILLPIYHRTEAPYVRISEPWGIYSINNHDVFTAEGALSQAKPLQHPSLLAQELSKDFVS